MNQRIIITDFETPGAEIEKAVLSALDAEVVKANCRTEEDVLAKCADANALIVGYAAITHRVISQLKDCRIISRYGVGVDMIDVPAATEHGILVCNVPDYCIEEVALHTLAMLLALSRQLCVFDRAVREGTWCFEKVSQIPHRLSRQTLGIVGYGRIGRELGRAAANLGMRVLVNDPKLQTGDLVGHELAELPRLLAESDFVSLHCPLTLETHHLIGATEIALMRPTACLINTSRGAVVDELALAHALQTKRIAGAALDVLEIEPPPKSHPLFALDNIIFTPHAAHYSEEALFDLRYRAAENVALFLSGTLPQTALNPQVLRREFV